MAQLPYFNVAQKVDSRARTRYRVRAPNARIQPMHGSTLLVANTNEVVEPRTIVIIARYFGRVFYSPMRQSFYAKVIYIK